MISSFSDVNNSLGEGILWHPELNTIFWVDINNNTIYKKIIDSSQLSYDDCWVFNETPSALVLLNSTEFILVVTNKRLVKLNITDGEFTTIIELNLPDGMRTNDAGVGPDNTLWFGTMERKPSGLNGGVYCVSESGEINRFDLTIGIPNTFLWSEEFQRFYISDSYIQKMYVLHKCSRTWKVDTFYENNATVATPDGGCFGENDIVYSAQWDGGCIQTISYNGDMQKKIELPVLKPTNCCIVTNDSSMLFVTTASEGLTSEEVDKYPLSGQLLCIDLSEKIKVKKQLIWDPRC